MIDGVVVVDKPAGWTSHDVVGKLRTLYGQKRVGHAGTLDPDATGVLVVGLGRVTRLLRFVQDTTKQYRGTVAFGIATDTLDAAGEILEREPMHLEREQVAVAARRFVGDIEQLPPMVSAVKVGGRKLYEMARKGEEVKREPRSITIRRFDIQEFVPGPFPTATVLVECSSGTYIRALAADLGTALGGCAHLAQLRRLAVGPFTLDHAVTIEALAAEPEAAVHAPLEAVAHLERVTVDDETATAVGHGAVFAATALIGGSEADGPFAVVDTSGELLAVYERHRRGCKPAVVLAS